MGSFGFGTQSSSSTPVNYKSLMTPEQLRGIKTLGPGLINQALGAFQGYGLTPTEITRQEEGLSGRISDYAGSLRDSVLGGYATRGVEGGVKNSFIKNLDAAKLAAFSSGLRDIEAMNQNMMQQKIANALGFVTWNPPSSMQQKSSGWDMKAAVG